MNKIIGYLIYALHEILPVVIILLLIFSNNIIIINIILILLILTLYQWYIFNECMIYPIIDHLIGNKVNNNIHESYYEFTFFGKNIKVFKSIYCSFHAYINFIIIILCIIKINYLYTQKNKKLEDEIHKSIITKNDEILKIE